MRTVEIPRVPRHYSYHSLDNVELVGSNDNNDNSSSTENRFKGVLSRWLSLALSSVFSLLFLFLVLNYKIPNPFLSKEAPSSNNASQSELITVGDPATDQNAIPFAKIVHPEQPSATWGNVQKPFPTGAFWTNAVVGSGEKPFGVSPYGIKILKNSIQVSYGPTRRVVTQVAITDPFFNDLQFSSVESVQSHFVEKYDNLSATIRFNLLKNGDSYFRSPLVKGSPFVTVLYQAATPVIYSLMLVSVERREGLVSPGVVYMVSLNNGQRWLLYCSDSSLNFVVSMTDLTLSADRPLTGYLRVAILPAQNIENSFTSLLPYITSYPTGAAVDISFPTGDTVQETFRFQVTGSGPLLMLSLPHHSKYMTGRAAGTWLESRQSGSHIRRRQRLLQSLGNIDFPASDAVASIYRPIYSMKGKLTPMVGTVWAISYPKQVMGWDFDTVTKISTNDLDDIAASLVSDLHGPEGYSSVNNAIVPVAQDPYSFGKEIGRAAQVAQLANYLGMTLEREAALNVVEKALTPWLAGINSNPLKYDLTYGGIVSTNGITSSTADFGSGWYNDHHFHFGYFVYAFATIARFHPLYYNDYKNHMDSIVSDICSFRSGHGDATTGAARNFPFARHKDVFDGHSWASGLFEQANGKSQESSSEAVNAYYACYLHGLATANSALTQNSMYLLTTEIIAAKMYWHMADDAIYDSFFVTGRMVGNVGALDVTASTWFGDFPEFVHGINFIPVSPISAKLFDPSFVSTEWAVLKPRLDTLLQKHYDARKSQLAENRTSCSSNPKCAALQLQDDCCPTTSGVLLGCCDAMNITDLSPPEWISVLYEIHAVANKIEARNQLLRPTTNFGNGNCRSIGLMWTATRFPPPPNYNESAVSTRDRLKSQYRDAVVPSCAVNSACDAMGLWGDCCPTPKVGNVSGVFLSCCPHVVSPPTAPPMKSPFDLYDP